MIVRTFLRSVTVVGGALAFHSLVLHAGPASKPSFKAHAVERFALPGANSLSFIENRGQFDPTVKFQAKSGGKVLWFTSSGIVVDVVRWGKTSHRGKDVGLRMPSSEEHGLLPAIRQTLPPPVREQLERLVFTEEFMGSNRDPKITACLPKPGTYNYFFGEDPSKWHSDVLSYSQLIYHDVWPGIDVRYTAKKGDIEQEFLVRPGANPNQIGIAYKGIDNLGIGPDGSVFAHTASGTLREGRPEIYQEIDGLRSPAKGRFVLTAKSSYAFRIASFDRARALVIDPTLLYSTFLGGGNYDSANGIAADNGGNAYVAGVTNSSNFPTTSGAFQTAFPGYIAFVTKLSPAGLLIYSTFVGGSPSNGAGASGIAVNAAGEAYIAGNSSGNGVFPTTANAYQTECNSSSFLAKLSAAGDSLLYSTCLGGGFGIGAAAVAVDNSGRAYLTGSGSIPTTPSAYQTKFGGVFLSVVDPSLSGPASLIYSSFLGGSECAAGCLFGDAGYAVAVDAYGDAYVAGVAESSDFPTTPGAFQTSNKQGVCHGTSAYGCGNAFVAKFNPAAAGPESLIYSTYLGGSGGGTSARGIAVDGSGSAYVVGHTFDTDFPTTPGAFQTTPSGIGFLTKFNAGGSRLSYSTFIEGAIASEVDAEAVTLDDLGNAYVVGSGGFDSIPVTPDAFQPTYGGDDSDAFLLEFNAQGTGLLYGSYLGGRGDDMANGVALDSTGDVYLTGYTQSQDFPVTAHAFQPNSGGGICPPRYDACPDAFVAKFPLGAPGKLAISGITPTVGGNAGTVSPQIFGTGFHAGATVKLACGGSDVEGTNVVASARGQLINTAFDLTKAQPSTCDLVVTNTDGTAVTLAHSFTVQQGGAPNIQVFVAGVAVRQGPPEVADAPTNAVFYVTVQNRGNVDSSGDILSLPLSSPFAGTSADPPDLAPQTSAVEMWAGDPLPAGSIQNSTATATTITALPCTLVSKIDACYYPNPAINWVSLDACIVNSSTFKNVCGVVAAQCVVRHCLAFGPAFLTCLGGCLADASVACAVPMWPVVTSCLESTSSPGQPVCTNGPLRCVEPSDPNSLTGPTGVASQRWVSAVQPLTYLITFENKPDASAPAQTVIVTQPLPPTLDLAKLGLLTITIPNGTSAIPVNIPAGSFDPRNGLNEFVTNVDFRPTQNMLVNIDAKLDTVARTLIWTFTTIDPSTGRPPLNPLIGFLPASSSGSVGFSVTPNSTVATDTPITGQATILFIGSSPMSTAVWTNSIDNTPPTSHVSSLPATESRLGFPVSWSGTDVGSGIQSYTIYVSEDGAPFSAWLTNTASTKGTYSGGVGHTYGFYSIATDLVGNVEGAKTAAEATTTVQGSSGCAADVSSQVTVTRGGFRYNHAMKSFVQTVTVTNNGPSLLDASLVLDGLSSNATLSNPGGTTKCDAPIGSPWIAVPGTLGVGQSASITLTFSDSTMAAIQYSTRVLAGSGQQ